MKGGNKPKNIALDNALTRKKWIPKSVNMNDREFFCSNAI